MTLCGASIGDDCTIDVATCSKQFLHVRLKGTTNNFAYRHWKGNQKNGPLYTSKDKVKQLYFIIGFAPSPYLPIQNGERE
uniref:Uncharacterized protein n=1 Tax=Oryza meridionalis TaxID=40149 RepID=A0A0E0F4A8_9ORYZ